MRVDEDLRIIAELQQPIAEILGDRRGASDAVHLAAPGAPENPDCLLERLLRQQLSRFGERRDVRREDALAGLAEAVALGQVLLDQPHRLDEIASEKDLQLLEALDAEALA